MKKYILTLLAALALSGITVMAADVQQPQESWYDWSKQKLQNAGKIVGHYVPSLHYLPAVGAGLASAGLGRPVMYYSYVGDNGLATVSNIIEKGKEGQVALYGSLPYLLALGYMIKKWNERGGKNVSDRTNYAYYAPGIIAALLPHVMGVNWGYPNLANKAGLGTSFGPWVLAPLLLGAGHLAHQYFNPPVQAPVAPVLPQQLEEQMQPLQNVEQPAEIEGILK